MSVYACPKCNEEPGFCACPSPDAERFATDSLQEQNRVLAAEVERLRAGLSMITQLVSHRVPCMLAQATLDGADLLDEETAIRVCSGEWRKPK